jgi:citronellol/citronellal dehydrogenase
MLKHCRKPEIMADAAYAVMTKGLDFTGKFVIDEQVLRNEGVLDFSAYAFAPGEPLRTDLFVDSE